MEKIQPLDEAVDDPGLSLVKEAKLCRKGN